MSLLGSGEDASAHVDPRSGAREQVFAKLDADAGLLSLRRFRMPEDVVLVHGWVTLEYAAYWGLTGCSVEQVAEAYANILKNTDVYVGLHSGAPTFLLECYSPAEHEIGTHYAHEPGDRGMHLLVAPPVVPVRGFTWAVFKAVLDFLFADRGTRRIVVEPDIRNAKIHALNLRAGFRYKRIVPLSSKVAHLAFCTRDQYAVALERDAARDLSGAIAREATLDHLRAETWAHVNAELVRKAIAEFSHERLLQPVLEEHSGQACRWALCAGNGVEYRFVARRLLLDHWDIVPGSISKTVGGEPEALDALDFIIEHAGVLGISSRNLLVYLEEISSTLFAAAYQREHERFSAADLVHADFQEIEGAMTEGHPAFLANRGRVGFDAADCAQYAPEAAAPVHLLWIAVCRGAGEFNSVADLTYEALLQEELGSETVHAFRHELVRQELNPEDYIFMPVHPWQWREKIAQVFAADIAQKEVVYLGLSGDAYRAQQSLRTFFNLGAPHRRYVKTALSVLNMGFMRGLSADLMRGTPAINDWIADLVGRDPYLAARRFGILREVASVGYRRSTFELALPKNSPFRRMLAALFRENPVRLLREDERLMTMAALLHRDRDGAALLPQLIGASGLDTEAWLARYLDCYLAPLLHCFYRHELAFMPHGENVILVLERHVPVAVWLKDIAEEAAIMNAARPLPDVVKRLAVSVPEELKTLCIFTDIFDGFLRFLAAIRSLRAGICSLLPQPTATAQQRAHAGPGRSSKGACVCRHSGEPNRTVSGALRAVADGPRFSGHRLQRPRVHDLAARRRTAAKGDHKSMTSYDSARCKCTLGVIARTVSVVAGASLVSTIGCGGGGEGGPGTGGESPAFLLGTRVWDDTSTTSYFHVVSSIEAQTAVDERQALEVPGAAKLYAIESVGWFAIGGGEEPTITRHVLDDEGRLAAASSISLQNYGVESLWDTLYVVSPTKMYYPDRDGQRLIVINPSAMEITGEVDLGETGRQGFLSLYSYAHIERGSSILFSVAWIDWDETDSILGETGLVVLDTDTDVVSRFDVDARCGGITTPVEMSSGDVYFVSSALAAAAHRLDRLPTPPCALRVRAGGDVFDADYLESLEGLTGNAQAGEPVPGGGSELFLRAFDENLGTVPDGALTWELTSQLAWRWLRWTPSTGDVSPVDALEPSTSDVLWFRVDGRVYGTETTADYSKTTLIELTAEGGPRRAMTAPGFVHGVARIR